MCLVAILGLFLAIGVTCYSVTERVLVAQGHEDATQSITSVLTSLWSRIWNLPPRIQQICWCQFWGWIGWFPFLFYSSTWVGETYYRYEHPEQAGGSGTTNSDSLGNIGRLGSLSLVLFSIVTLISSVLLPYLVRKPEDESNHKSGSTTRKGRFTPRPPPSLGKEVQKVLMRIYESTTISRYKPDLVTTWGLSNLAFAAIMVWAPFVTSLRFATTLVALCGVPWAVSCWAPFAEMGLEINRLAHGGVGGAGTGVGEAMVRGGGYAAVRPSMDDDDDVEMEEAGRPNLLHAGREDSESGELAGIYLGVLNVYTTLPQFVGTAVSWVVFSLLEPGKNDGAAGEKEGDAGEGSKYLDTKGVNSIAVCLFIGAVCAVVAAEATRRLRRMR
ncbi:hypothetical protein PMZ80_006923 [Knufia obscura]|nr:hypothetical protein PMZ80_006923 [Knufia obscura]